MARYIGPRIKRCRSFGVVLPGLTTKTTLTRPFAPGVHGAKRRRRDSDYRTRLVEKQKLRYHYGLLEKQFTRYVSNASKQRGPAGDNLLRMLESRLDNIVWRLGLSATIPAARQLVVHGHIKVNGKRVDRPSFLVSPGDEISVGEKSKAKPFIAAALELSTTKVRPSYLEFDPAKAAGKMLVAPGRADAPFDINTQAVVEYYSQKL
ncbi:MAG: 30S ribosomal protein S4 [Deltaproteobacteria bacterium]|jgi:small subunit ribosomal protein S4|nr:30S ribosomal protein S4 [Deltaproteobacteria bacterium]